MERSIITILAVAFCLCCAAVGNSGCAHVGVQKKGTSSSDAQRPIDPSIPQDRAAERYTVIKAYERLVVEEGEAGVALDDGESAIDTNLLTVEQIALSDRDMRRLLNRRDAAMLRRRVAHLASPVRFVDSPSAVHRMACHVATVELRVVAVVAGASSCVERQFEVFLPRSTLACHVTHAIVVELGPPLRDPERSLHSIEVSNNGPLER